MTENHSLDKNVSNLRRRKIIASLQSVSREGWKLDDNLRRLCVEQTREMLLNPELNHRDKLTAAAMVLKLSDSNLERTLLVVEINSILDEGENHDEQVTVSPNKKFFGNDAHETVESAAQNLSGETSKKSQDPSS